MFFIADDVLSNADDNVRISFAVDIRRMQVNRLQPVFEKTCATTQNT